MSNKNWNRPTFRKQGKKAANWKDAYADDKKHERMVERFLKKREKESPNG